MLTEHLQDASYGDHASIKRGVLLAFCSTQTSKLTIEVISLGSQHVYIHFLLRTI